MSIAVELTDRHRNELRVEVPLDATVGALRNAVNGALPRGYVIEEHDVVPKPFAHYVEDDPECFRGPADGWRLAEVFFDELASEPLEAVRCRATAPLGPPRAVAVLVPRVGATQRPHLLEVRRRTAHPAVLARPRWLAAAASRLTASSSASRDQDTS